MSNRARTGKVRLKRGDIVRAVSGADADGKKTGKVLVVDRARNRAVVEGFNLVKKHMRKSQDHPQGGIVEKEASIHISNLKVVSAADGD